MVDTTTRALCFADQRRGAEVGSVLLELTVAEQRFNAVMEVPATGSPPDRSVVLAAGHTIRQPRKPDDPAFSAPTGRLIHRKWVGRYGPDRRACGDPGVRRRTTSKEDA